MNLNTAISRIHHLYSRIESSANISPGYGQIFHRYDTKEGIGVLIVILEPPAKRIKGKKKDFDKIIEKSGNSGKSILPKDFPNIISYLSSVFSTIIKPRDEILKHLRKLMAGLRLELIPMDNMKYVFKNPTTPQIIVYDTIIKGQFALYINIVNIEEQGLILAHERQIEFICNEISKGIDPTRIKNLPSLRTGDTEFHPRKHPVLKEEEKKDSMVKLAKFRDGLKQKKIQEEIDVELDSETVINFGARSEEKITQKNSEIKDIFGNPLPSAPAPAKPAPMPLQKTESKEKPKPAPAPVLADDPPFTSTTQETYKDEQQSELSSPDLDQLQSEIIQLRQNFQEENSRLQEQIILVTDSLTAQLSEKDAKIKQIQKSHDDLDLQWVEFQEKTKIKEEKASFIITKLTKTKDELQNQLTTLKAEMKKTIQESVAVNPNIEKLEDQMNDLLEENELLAKAIKETDSENTNLKKNMVDLNSDRQNVLNDKLTLEIMVTELQDRIFELEADLEEPTPVEVPKEETQNQIQKHIDDIIVEREQVLKDVKDTQLDLNKEE